MRVSRRTIRAVCVANTPRPRSRTMTPQTLVSRYRTRAFPTRDKRTALWVDAALRALVAASQY